MKIIGKYSYEAEIIKVKYPEGGNLIIGKFCSIGSNVTVYLGGEHHIEWLSTYPFGHINCDIFNKKNGEHHPASKGNVIIENDVWIGDNVTIMSGSHICSGSVIAANSHVSGLVKPYSVVGGNPMIFYYFRFSEEVISKLLSLQWWNWPEEEINKLSPILNSEDYSKIMEL